MPKKKLILVFGVLIFIGAGCFVRPQTPQKPVACTEEAKICPDGSAVGRTGLNCEFAPCPESKAQAPFSSEKVKVSTPLPNSLVTSPLVIKGEARGTWYFEASFPIRIYDNNGKELGVAVAQADGEWMTTEFVPFSATLNFSAPGTDVGALVFQKDNPSGLPQYDEQVNFRVRFR